MRDYIPPFRRLLPARLLTVAHAPTTKDYPPSRVTDLKVVNSDGMVEMQWTSPGGDLDHGVGKYLVFIAWIFFLALEKAHSQTDWHAEKNSWKT